MIIYEYMKGHNPMAIESNFLQLAKDRYSVRHYSSQPVEEEKIKALEEIIKYTPTGINRQPQRMVVVKSPEAMAALNKVCPCIYGAPMAFIVAYDPSIAAKGSARPSTGFAVTVAVLHRNA